MHPSDWQPQTLEDSLLQEYLAEHPGELFLELNVGAGDASHGPRRLDGVLIPGPEPRVHPQNSYTLEEARAAIQDAAVHLLEAKRTLNRKTHMNMGNLVGWIYGDQPEEFRLPPTPPS